MLASVRSSSAHLRCRLVRVSSDIGPLEAYRDNPVGFAKKILGVKLTWKQKQVLLAVRDHKSVAVAACHGAGKTFLAAVVALWWFCTREPAIVVTTAPTGRQVKNLLWRYIRRLHAKAKQRLPGRLLQVGIETQDPEWYAMGFASRDSNAAQGVHGPWVLVIYDEATGVNDEIRTSIEGALGDPNARELAIGNPTGESGFFRDAFERLKDFWHTINISALDIPNVRRRRMIVPGMVGHEWVDKIRRMFGEKSPYWICRVLGRFASFADEKVITLEVRQAARDRWASTDAGNRRIIGCDVAGAGDDSTAMVMFDARRLYTIAKFQIADPREQARTIIDYCIEHQADALHFDATGLGWALAGMVREEADRRGCGFEVTDVVLGKASTQPMIYTRLLDEVWFTARDLFDPNNPGAIAINPDDQELFEQLGVRGYRLDDRNRIKVETKKELRKRGAGSPDVGDAAVLALYRAPEFWWSA